MTMQNNPYVSDYLRRRGRLEPDPKPAPEKLEPDTPVARYVRAVRLSKERGHRETE